jgi:hypothetical protein
VPTPWLCRKTMISRTAFCSVQARAIGTQLAHRDRCAVDGPLTTSQNFCLV